MKQITAFVANGPWSTKFAEHNPFNIVEHTLEIMHEHQFAANGVPINALADSRPG
ncbi:MAG: hypothetical protein BroJett015_40290 [Chloroflexota bacterium]|nr:MAG: hypothetical protein BroJett015_40290 [Chloroflexota bacterium]